MPLPPVSPSLLRGGVLFLEWCIPGVGAVGQEQCGCPCQRDLLIASELASVQAAVHADVLAAVLAAELAAALAAALAAVLATELAAEPAVSAAVLVQGEDVRQEQGGPVHDQPSWLALVHCVSVGAGASWPF